MRKKLLLALAIFATTSSFAADRDAHDASASDNSPHLSMPAWGGGDGGSNVHFTSSVILGYSRISATGGGTNAGGGGFGYGGQLGAAIVMPTNLVSKTRVVSFSLHFEGLNGNEKYKDASGDEHKDNLSFIIFGMPVSYTQLYTSSSGRHGVYWQIGANLDYLYKARIKDAEQTKHFNNVLFEPFISFGFHVPYLLVLRSTRAEVGHGTALIGPYVSYVLNNMSQDNGVSMHGMFIGIKWTYIRNMGE